MENKNPHSKNFDLAKQEADNAKIKAEQKSAIELVREVDKELDEYQAPFRKPWREQDNAYYGKQHKTGEDKKTVKNHIFKIIEGEVPILTDSQCGTQVNAENQARQGDADILNKAIKHVYQDQDLQLILPTLVRQSLISAPGFLYVYYNPDANGGDGKIEYKQLPWEYVKLDGNAQTIEQAERANIKIPTRRDRLARMWPEKRKEILEKKASSESQAQSHDSEGSETRDNSGSDDSGGGKPKRGSGKDIVNYLETWVKSFDLEDIPAEDTEAELVEERQELLQGNAPSVGKWENHKAHQEDHFGTRAELLAPLQLPGDTPFEQVAATVQQLLQSNPETQGLDQILLKVKIIDNHNESHSELLKLNPTSQREKYKDGWRVLKTCDDIVLYDGGNPDERNGIGHIPIVVVYCYKDDSIYGFSEIKNILDPQRSLNTVDWHEYENLKVNSNTGWKYDLESGVDPNSLTNAPGILIGHAKGTSVERLSPGTVSPQLERRRDTDAMAMEQISGVNEATQGNAGQGATSGVAIQKLQAQAIGRIRLKDRYLQSYSMKRLGTITAHLILIHWTDEKNLRLRADDGVIEDVVFDPVKMTDLGYTFEIAEGSMAGIDKDALNGFFKELLAGQHITYEEFLLVADFPKKALLLSKLKERIEKDQSAQKLQSQLQELQQQNITLKGLVNPGLVSAGDEKNLFDQAAKQALLNQLMQQAQAESQAQEQEINGNSGVDNGQPVNQGNM
jgi:hypothetical protein